MTLRKTSFLLGTAAYVLPAPALFLLPLEAPTSTNLAIILFGIAASIAAVICNARALRGGGFPRWRKLEIAILALPLVYGVTVLAVTLAWTLTH